MVKPRDDRGEIDPRNNIVNSSIQLNLVTGVRKRVYNNRRVQDSQELSKKNHSLIEKSKRITLL